MHLPLYALLYACLDVDARPYEEYLAELDRLDGLNDTDDSDNSDDSDINADTDDTDDTDDPGFEPSLCSEDGGVAQTVSFGNLAGVHADLYWVPSDCQPVTMLLIAAGESGSLNTQVGHAFWLREAFGDKAWLDEVRIEADVTQVSLGAP
jgi:hypothetical protein